jgi:HK97 family phage portal protein
MNTLERIANNLGRAAGAFKAGLGANVKRARAGFIGAWAEAGKWVGGDYSRRGAQRRAMLNSWVYTAIEMIMRESSAAKFGVVQQTDVDDEPVAVRNHPLEKLLRRPNPWIGRSFLWQYTIAWLMLDGNAYWFVSLDDYGRPIEIWPLPAQDVEVRPGDSERFIDEYWYTANGTRFEIPTEYIVHFRLPNPFDIFRGLSPLTAAMLAVDSDTAMARWNGAFFGRDNVMPSAIINLSSGVPGASIDQTDLNALKEELRTEYVAAARKTAVVSADTMQAMLLGWNAKDMDFFNGRQFTKEEIYAILGVPAGLLDKNATEANAVTADKVFKEKTIWPLLTLIAEQMTVELVAPFYGPDLEALFDDIRPADRALQLQEDTASRETLTIDERRKRFWKLDPLPDGRGAKTAVESGAPAFPPLSTASQAVIDQAQPAQISAPATPAVALNGAQVQAAADIVKQVAGGTLPRDSALNMLESMFAMTPDQATGILGSAGQGNFNPAKALPAPSSEIPTSAVSGTVEDLRRWRDKALKAFKSTGSGLVKFESNAIGADLAEQIRDGLQHAQSLDEIKAVFLSASEVAESRVFFRGGSAHRFEGYPAAAVEPVRAAA